MPTIEEMSAWSDVELVAEIQTLLPPGWFVRIDANPEGYWEVSVDRATDTPEPITEFFESHIDKRIALLNIYGAIGAYKARSRSEQWIGGRRELTKQPVRIKSSAIPDPADLDPEEVEAVYLLMRGKRNDN